MARVIKLKESDLTNIIRKIVKEQQAHYGDGWIGGPKFPGGGPGPYNPYDPEDPFGSGTWNTGGGDGGGGITATEVVEVFQAKGVMDVIQKYKKFYNTIRPEDRKGVATPDEVRRKGMEIIEDEGGDDTPAAMWIFVGWLAISVIVYVASHYWPWQCC